MKKRFKPTMILGLGSQGSEIAQGLYKVIVAKNSDLARLVGCLFVDGEGALCTHENDDIIFRCKDLRSDYSIEVFQHNYTEFVRNEKEFENVIADAIQKIRSMDVVLELREQGYKIDDGIEIFIVSTLFDQVGSSAIIPFLGFIQYLLGGRLTGTVVETNMLGFFPDLFEEYKREDLAYARTYATLNEIDHIVDNPKILSLEERTPISYVYLFTGKNEDGIEVGSYRDLIPMVGEVLSSLLFGEVASDDSFSSTLLHLVDGKRARYSSFGLSRLVFPITQVMNALSSTMASRILEAHGLVDPRTYERGYISSEVKSFLIENQFDKLVDLIRTDKDGKPIHTNFKYRGPLNERAVVDNFLVDIENQALEFDRDNVTIMSRNVATRKDELYAEKVDILNQNVRRTLDELGRGVRSGKGMYYTQAFLEMLSNNDSAYLKGELIGNNFTLDSVERDLKLFFDRLLGIDREKLIELKRDLKDKKSLQAQISHSLSINLATNNAEALKEQTERLGLEIEELRGQCEALEVTINEADFKISDPSERRRLLEMLLEEEQEKKVELSKNLKTVDEEYRAQRRKLDDLYESRRKILKNLLLIFPLVGVVIFSLVLYALVQLMSSLDVSIIIETAIFKALPLLFVGYAVWAFFKYWNGIRSQIALAELQLENLKLTKTNLLLKIQEFYNSQFKLSFEHTTFGHLLSWMNDFRNLVRQTAYSLKSFIDELIREAALKKTEYEATTFPNSIFLRSVVNNKDVERFVNENARLEIEVDRFFDQKPMSRFFNEYRTQGNLHAFFMSVSSFTEILFKPVRDRSIEEFLRERESDALLSTSDKLINIYNSAKAFSHLDVEKGLDVSQSIVYLGVERSENSYSRDLLRKQGFANISFYSTRNKYEIVMSKLKIGFPAFHMALVRHGKQLISKNKDFDRIYISAEWQLEDLFPTKFYIGEEERELRRVIYLGKAFGLLTNKEGELHFENVALGQVESEIIEFLRSMKGSSVRNKVTEAIEREKSMDNAMERLIEYRENYKIKGLELELVDETIGEVSPLS